MSWLVWLLAGRLAGWFVSQNTKTFECISLKLQWRMSLCHSCFACISTSQKVKFHHFNLIIGDSFKMKRKMKSIWGHFGMIWVPLIPLEGRITVNPWVAYDETFLYRWYGVFLNDKAPIHRAWWVTEWFDEYENDMNHMLWTLSSPDLKSVEHVSICVRHGPICYICIICDLGKLK